MSKVKEFVDFVNNNSGKTGYMKRLGERYYKDVQQYLMNRPTLYKHLGLNRDRSIRKNFWREDPEKIQKLILSYLKWEEKGKPPLKQPKPISAPVSAQLMDDETGKYVQGLVRNGRFSTQYSYIWKGKLTGEGRSPDYEDYASAIISILEKLIGRRSMLSIFYIDKNGASIRMDAPTDKLQKRDREIVDEMNDPEVLITILQEIKDEKLQRDESGDIMLYSTFATFGLGSDVEEIENQRIDFSKFLITTYKNIGGGADNLIIPDARHKNKKTKIHFTKADPTMGENDPRQSRFIIEDFNSIDNNCIIEIFRNVCDNKEKTSDQIRVILGIEKGIPITKDELPALEKYFGKKCSIIYKSKIELKPTAEGDKSGVNRFNRDNIYKFRTEVEYTDSFLHFNETSDFLIHIDNIDLLKQDEAQRINHCTLIKSRYEPVRCPLSGIVIDKKHKYAPTDKVIEFLIASGRLDKVAEFKDTDDGEVALRKLEKKEAEAKAKPKPLYWGYDFETVFDEFGDVIPYSVCCVVGEYDENNKFVEVMSFSKLGYDCGSLFASWLYIESSKQNKTEIRDNILVGYNSSRFDNFLLVNEVARLGLINRNSVMVAGNSILELKFLTFRSIDLCRFLLTSLKNACEGFKCNLQKSKLSHSDMQKLYFTCPEKYIEAIKENEEMYKGVMDYNMLDCTSMMELYGKFRLALLTLMKVDINDFMTTSQVAYECFGDSLNDGLSEVGKKQVMTVKTKEKWDFIRAAVVAGRSQIFTKGHYQGLFQSWDVKSLYPFAMLAGEYPIGEEIETDKEVDGKLGIYRCKISNQPKVKIIPHRQKGSPLNWNEEEEFEANITSVDIKTLREHGAVVEVFNGLYWDKSSKNVFSPYIKKLKDEKTRQDKLKGAGSEEYNPALRETVKLLLNSLSGKVIQRIFKTNSAFITDTKDYMQFMEKHTDVVMRNVGDTGAVFMKGEQIDKKYDPKSVKPNHLGVFIYSYSRRHMYNSILSKVGDNLFATDTDSCHVRLDEFNKLDMSNNHWRSEEIPEIGTFYKGEEFGNFEGELEYPTRDVYYIAPKCYGIFFDESKMEKRDGALYYKNKKVKDDKKMRFKGIGMRDKFLGLADKPIIEKEKFDALSMEQKAEYYEQLQPALCEDLFKSLSEGKYVSILCSQLSKKIIPSDNHGASVFKISQVYTYKTISAPAEDLIY